MLAAVCAAASTRIANGASSHPRNRNKSQSGGTRESPATFQEAENPHDHRVHPLLIALYYPQQIDDTLDFLHKAKAIYEQAGYEVQTLRIATQPFPEYTRDLSAVEIIQVYAQARSSRGEPRTSSSRSAPPCSMPATMPAPAAAARATLSRPRNEHERQRRHRGRRRHSLERRRSCGERHLNFWPNTRQKVRPISISPRSLSSRRARRFSRPHTIPATIINLRSAYNPQT